MEKFQFSITILLQIKILLQVFSPYFYSNRHSILSISYPFSFQTIFLTFCAGNWFADHNEWPNRIQQFVAFFLNSSVRHRWMEIIKK